MSAQVEELSDNKVRITVDVPGEDVHHAVEHAASDLAANVKIPGFRKGKVPMPVLVNRIGRDRLYTEAIESHIGGWFWDAATRSGIRPADRPELDYELPANDREDWSFTATVRCSRNRRWRTGRNSRCRRRRWRSRTILSGRSSTSCAARWPRSARRTGRHRRAT